MATLISPAVPPEPTFSLRGFTLTEMAVALAIMALLIGGMLMPLSTQQEVRNIAETQKSLTIVSEALYGFAVVNGRLPRPATSAIDGAENPTSCNDATCSGFIPWATLGVPKTDSWGSLIRYSVTPDFANAPFTLSTIANRKVQTRKADDGSLVFLAGQANCNTASQCMPAVIFSHGKSRWGTSETGSNRVDGSLTNVDEDANNTGPTDYINRMHAESADTNGGEFDDLVVWLPPTILINRMIMAGKLP